MKNTFLNNPKWSSQVSSAVVVIELYPVELLPLHNLVAEAIPTARSFWYGITNATSDEAESPAAV